MELQTRDAAAMMECSGMAGQKDELHRFSGDPLRFMIE